MQKCCSKEFIDLLDLVIEIFQKTRSEAELFFEKLHTSKNDLKEYTLDEMILEQEADNIALNSLGNKNIISGKKESSILEPQTPSGLGASVSIPDYYNNNTWRVLSLTVNDVGDDRELQVKNPKNNIEKFKHFILYLYTRRPPEILRLTDAIIKSTTEVEGVIHCDDDFHLKLEKLLLQSFLESEYYTNPENNDVGKILVSLFNKYGEPVEYKIAKNLIESWYKGLKQFRDNAISNSSDSTKSDIEYAKKIYFILNKYNMFSECADETKKKIIKSCIRRLENISLEKLFQLTNTPVQQEF